MKSHFAPVFTTPPFVGRETGIPRSQRLDLWHDTSRKATVSAPTRNLLFKQTIAQHCPDNPVISGFKVYSQVDEDGIIQELFRRVSRQKLDNTLIEIGCGNGVENNTHYLMLQGYRGTG